MAPRHLAKFGPTRCGIPKQLPETERWQIVNDIRPLK